MAEHLRLNDSIRKAIDDWHHSLINDAYEQHRLAYVFMDEDNPTKSGKPSQLFVCKCQEAFERRAFNAHIRDMYKEVG